MDVKQYMQGVGQQARAASRQMVRAGTNAKNAALLAMADAIEAARDTLLAENAKDMAAGAARGLDAALLDRLELNPERIAGMAEGLRQIAAPLHGEICDDDTGTMQWFDCWYLL